MKWVCILLLAGNLGYFGWSYNEQAKRSLHTTAQIPPLPVGVAGLTLISELSSPPELRDDLATDGSDGAQAGVADESITVISPNAMMPAADVCVAAGPFTDRTTFDALQDWLTPRAVRIVVETKAVRTRQLYWVFLEPVDGQQAKRQLADLKAKGVNDLLLIRRGGLKNAISLGLFSSQDSVNNRLSELERKGYKPVVVPRFETRDEHWIRAELGVGFEDTSTIPPEVIGDYNLSDIPCTTVTSPDQA